MHATFITTTALALLSMQTVLAMEHGNMPMQNHARFLRVKRGGPTIHLIGDETVASWSGGGVPGLPAIQAPAPSPSSSWNLLDSINAGLGAPIGKPTSSSASSSLASSSSSVSTTASSVANVKAGVRKIAVNTEEVASPAVEETPAASAPTLAISRGKPAKRSLPEEGVVRDDASEDTMMALGRRAAAANSTLSLGRNRVVLSSTASASVPAESSASSSAAAANSTASARAGMALPAFSPAELATPQGWGGPFGNKYTSAAVINHSAKSASTRAVVRDMWPSIISQVKSGDVVVIQLGHKDSGMPSSPSDTKAGCLASVPGLGSETMTISGCDGKQEVVQTYGTYINQMCASVKAKGATCAVASITPKNEWKRDNTLTYNSPYIGYAKSAAAAAGAVYVPHEETLAKKLIADGQAATAMYYLGGDALQMNAGGADIFASTFAAAAYCAGASSITSAFTAAGQAMKGKYC